MAQPLHLLIVDDSENDALLVVFELKRGGYDASYERVDTLEALSAALDAKRCDVIICDWVVPGLNALSVLSMIKQRGIDVPCLIVSGTIDDDVAVDALRSGAHDFLHKGKLSRLCPAIERELRETEVRAERRKMQEQLFLADRLTSLGTLAAGVAHEINNPLTAVVANLELVARKLDEVEGPQRASQPSQSAAALAGNLRELVDDAREAGERIRRIVRDLAIFLRSDDDADGSINVHQVLESAVRIASPEIRQRAQLLRDYGDVPLVHGSEARLGQVFMNLLVNAAHAIPEDDAKSHEIRVVTRVDQPGFVAIEISDTGSGISPEHLSRIFDPFFTTKPIGVGTGLGLAISHRVVTALGGEIKVATKSGKGSSFTVVLPVARQLPRAVGAVLREAYSLPPTGQHRGRVLVVDDEATIASAIRAMLSVAHEITVETSAAPVLARIRAGERYDVILCDLMMPDVSGMDLYEALAQEVPQQARRMVFITGGAFTYRARTFLDEVQNPRIEKPFTSNQLLSLINSWVR